MQKFLSQMEWKLNRYAIRGLMKYLCIAMLGVFILDFLPLPREASELLYFSRDRILQGEIWRLVTFVLLPPTGSLLWIAISLYFYYFLGTSLENRWGSTRFNLFYLLGILCNILAGFITGYATNHYLNLSLLLCFAMLYPEQEFMLMMFIPLKVKWIGLADAVLLLCYFLLGSWADKLGIVVSLAPFFLFMGRDGLVEMKMMWKRLKYRMQVRR